MTSHNLDNGKLIVPDGYSNSSYMTSHEQQIVQVFQAFHCYAIDIRPDGSGRLGLGIHFDNIDVHGASYAQMLIYSRDGPIEGYQRVFADWYYFAPLYAVG